MDLIHRNNDRLAGVARTRSEGETWGGTDRQRARGLLPSALDPCMRPNDKGIGRSLCWLADGGIVFMRS
jgi:hypothetical protein